MSDRGTITFVNHYAAGGTLEVLVGSVNGVPIYGPYGVSNFTVTVSEQWLKDNPPKPPEWKAGEEAYLARGRK